MKWNTGKILSKRESFSPDKPAVIFEDTPITYRELNRETNRVAHFFKEKGLKKGDRIAVDLLNSPEFLACYFAAAKLGLIFVPLNYRLVSQELKYQINRCNCRLLVFNDLFTKYIEPIRDFLDVEKENFICVTGYTAENYCPEWALDYYSIIEKYPFHEPVPDEFIDLDDPFIILFTSGTTGNPKGAVLTHGQTYFKCFQVINYTDMRQDDIFQSQAPLCHSAGLAAVSTPALCRGATLLMRSKFDAEKFALDIEKYKATIVFSLTTMMRFVLDTGILDQVDLSSVRFAWGGGEKTPPEFFDELDEKGLHILPGFGQTENSAMVLMPGDAPKSKNRSAGLPNFFTDLWIQNETGEKLGPGEIGQIVAMGPNVMKGYWDMPVETSSTIVDDVLYTGDLGYLDEDGYLYVVDRVKDMYRSGAENVYPAEVEAVLINHPKINKIAIIGVPDEKWGETGKAFIVCNQGKTISYEEVLSFLNSKLARFKFPRSIQLIDSLPLTVTGKLKKSVLKKQFTDSLTGGVKKKWDWSM
ncbi:class I adenylate-forming enzyme family protein [Desulfobacula toluolica]|uniref:Putative long-chain-fatty-acid--CoA ligase n=1 Tax=Desulfobacula toluolica (strain DSM 7467 / Tol2) TaxID=651182 RepID=K0N2G6_DESTT|nr:AMP-binding protein [Desulfobacula toluolica]CCK78334.1 putative long-chain-fatty-acid--CoA ligase [Desulfobacula toluolica Tol2]